MALGRGPTQRSIGLSSKGQGFRLRIGLNTGFSAGILEYHTVAAPASLKDTAGKVTDEMGK